MEKSNEQTTYQWLEKLTIYLEPDGGIMLRVGSERLHVTSEQLEQILHNHLSSHACFVEIVRNGGNGHVS